MSGDNIVRVPFKAPTLFILQDTSTPPNLKFNTTGGTANAIESMDINPLNGLYGGTPPSYSAALFGLGIAKVAGAFSQFRIAKNLTMRFNSTSVSNTGNAVVGWARDANFVPNNPTFQQVSATKPSVSFPMFATSMQVQSLVIPGDPTEGGWRYVATTDATLATDRLTAYGTMVIGEIGLTVLGGAAIVATLELEGEVEFRGLFDVVDLEPTILLEKQKKFDELVRQSLLRNASSSSSSSSSTILNSSVSSSSTAPLPTIQEEYINIKIAK